LVLLLINLNAVLYEDPQTCSCVNSCFKRRVLLIVIGKHRNLSSLLEVFVPFNGLTFS